MTSRNPMLLIVEDDAEMLTFLKPSLAAHGFKMLVTGTVGEGLLAARTHPPELILLDLGLPDGDGIDFTRRLRRWSKVPVIVISSRRLDEEKVEALDAGADDYLTKPFGIGELLARIRVAFRHSKASSVSAGPVFEFGPLQIDLDRREVLVGERPVHLTAIEYKLLVFMAQNAGKVLTHRQLLEHVWGPSHVDRTHHLVVRMAHLRQKIEPNTRRPALLVTEPGVGYRLCIEPRSAAGETSR
jgi:two-component system, OmpR family, KDP operon response regulator KdpE